MIHAAVFELDSIQAYLFSTGRLRDVAGASELLDQLTGGEDNLLDQVLATLDASGRIELPRRAGGAFYAFSDDEALLQRFLALWTLSVQQRAPGVSFSLGTGSAETYLKAFDSARTNLRADGSRKRAVLPLAAPVAERSRRTGIAATEWNQKDGPIDAGTVNKKHFADLAKAGFLKRFAPQDASLGWRDWPTDLEGTGKEGSFPFLRDDRTVALIHADGNGLGKLLLQLRQAIAADDSKFVSLFKQFSNLIAEVTQKAAQQTTQKVLMPVREAEQTSCLPARPILLGGDDVTVIVRSDLAIDYCQQFAKAFEQASREALDKLRKETGIEGLPERLTLGFGVVFLRASQPFHMAINLAEALTAEAKKKAKSKNENDPDSSLAFYRITGSLVDSYDQIVERVLTHQWKDKRYVDTLGAYFLGDSSAEPRLDDLIKLARLLGSDDMARGPTRQLMTLMGLSRADAVRRYARWRRLMKERNEPRLKEFDDLMKELANVSAEAELPYGAAAEESTLFRSPLGDALALISVGGNISTTNKQNNDKEAE